MVIQAKSLFRTFFLVLNFYNAWSLQFHFPPFSYHKSRSFFPRNLPNQHQNLFIEIDELSRQQAFVLVASTDDSAEKLSLDEELDIIDDLVMGRNPDQGRDRVKVFGAWLDADVAGRKAGDNRKIKEKLSKGEMITREEQGEIFFEEAVKNMNVGKYDNSVALIKKALEYSGEDTVRGGGFQLWLAQAVYAIGRRTEARDILRKVKKHKDSNIRRVAVELLYIYEAPEIALTEDDFVRFPDMSDINEKYDEKAFRAGEFTQGTYSKYKEQPPEAYDWSLDRTPVEIDVTKNLTLVFMVAIFSISYFALII